MNYENVFATFQDDLTTFLKQKNPFSSQLKALLYVSNVALNTANISKKIANAKYQCNHQSGRQAKPYEHTYFHYLDAIYYMFLPFKDLKDLDVNSLVFLDLKAPVSDCIESRRYQDATTFYSWCAKDLCQRIGFDPAHRWKISGGLENDLYNLGYRPSETGYYPCWAGYQSTLAKVD